MSLKPIGEASEDEVHSWESVSLFLGRQRMRNFDFLNLRKQENRSVKSRTRNVCLLVRVKATYCRGDVG